MNPHSVEPEFTVLDSAKIALTANQLANLIQELRALEVDSVVLYKEVSKLEGFSGRIADDIRALVLSLRELESQEF